MNPATYRIPLNVAEQILATFGITRPTEAYHRWVKADGFDLKDFNEVLYQSPFIFIIDWRAWLYEELQIIQKALARLNVQLHVKMQDEDGDSIMIWSNENTKEEASYTPADETTHLDTVFHALQKVVPQEIEFRADRHNGEGDTWIYAVLPRDEWADMEKLAPEELRQNNLPYF